MKTPALLLGALLLAACGGGSGEPNTPEQSSSSAPETSASATPPPAETAPPTSTPAPSATASAVPTTTPAANAPDATRGEKLFTDNSCTNCHGTKAKPKHDIFGKIKWTDDEKQTATGIIKKGKGKMPAFGDKLKDNDIADLLAFISSK